MAEKPIGFSLNQPLIAYMLGIVALATIAFNGAAWVIERGNNDTTQAAAIVQLKTDMVAGDNQLRQDMTDAINRGRATNEKVNTTLETLVETTHQISLDVARLQTMQEAGKSTLTGLNMIPNTAISRPAN